MTKMEKIEKKENMGKKGESYTYDVFGIPQHFRANRTIVPSRCTKVHQCRAVRWQFRSNMSSTWCRMFRGRKYRKANRSVQRQLVDSPDVYHRNNLPAMDSRNPRWHHDAYQRILDHWDSRKVRDVHWRTPSNDRSSQCRRLLGLLSGMDLPVVAFGRRGLETQKRKKTSLVFMKLCIPHVLHHQLK